MQPSFYPLDVDVAFARLLASNIQLFNITAEGSMLHTKYSLTANRTA